MRNTRSFGIVFHRFLDWLAYLSGVVLIFLMLLIIYEVIMRYVFKNPPGWAIEVSEYTMLYMVFLGAGWLLKEKDHVQVDILYLRFNSKNQLLLDIIISIFGTIVFLVVFWFSTVALVDFIQRNLVDVGTLKIPKAIPFVVIPIGLFAITVEYILQSVSHLKLWKASGNNPSKEVRQ